jgi:hypothetical protein
MFIKDWARFLMVGLVTTLIWAPLFTAIPYIMSHLFESNLAFYFNAFLGTFLVTSLTYVYWKSAFLEPGSPPPDWVIFGIFTF